MRLLEDTEQTRLLLGVTVWNVHDLRNFALYGDGSIRSFEDYDRENLRLYEAIKPLDYAASSLLAALDLGDDRSAEDDLQFIRAELARVAPEVLANYRAVASERDKAHRRLTETATKAGLQVKRIEGQGWADPLRERQRQLGVQLGWRTNIEPPPAFREHFWNSTQKLDIRYQLQKGRMLGVTFLVPKDPILRWDWAEPQRGRFDFAALDRLMKLAAEYGYKVKLILPTMGGGVPDWWARERPESLVRNEKGETAFQIDGGSYAHDFMGPVDRKGPWYESRAMNLADEPTRERFAAYVQALADHCRKAGYMDRILVLSADLFHAQRHWRIPAGVDRRTFVLEHYRRVAEITRKAFAPIPVDLEVSDGEAHGIDADQTAHEWRSVGLTQAVGLPAVASETPFFEDLMRAVALQTATKQLGREPEAGPFFYQNCEYGFGTMLSINYFTALLRDGLWSDGWFGPEGILRWGYFPQVFTYNDRQLQWSAITNGYLANRQAHLLGPTIANTRVTPADVILLLPSSSMDLKQYRTNRELVGWGWALTALKVPYDVITEAALANGVPERARLLILPQAAVLAEPQVKAIREFVDRGGLMISSLVPGTDGQDPSPLADVLGCDLFRSDGKPVELTQTGVKGTWLQVTVGRGMHSGKYTPVPPPDTGYPRSKDVDGGRTANRQPFQALAPAQDARLVASYGTGQAAIVDHTFGKGRALTLGYPFGNELMFADWTSIAFGKIYNGWARDEQMLGMIRWLRDELTAIGYVRRTSVPEAWRFRLQRWEAAASSLAYPKGPLPEKGNEWPFVVTYLDPRKDHRIAEDHDDMDYAAEVTWRDRPGIATRYLAVANRESAYAGERAAVQFWMMPHRFCIRVDDPAIRQVYDIAAEAPVHLQRDERGVSFYTTVPPALGRVFAISNTDTVEVLGKPTFAGLSFDAMADNVARIAPPPTRTPAAEVMGAPDIHEWLAARKGGKLTICYGDAEYRPAAERLGRWLKKTFDVAAELTGDDGRFEVEKNGFQASFTPSPAQVLIGNAWTNNTIASLDCAWPYNTQQAPATMAGRFTATYAWPGGKRGIVALSRELELRRDDHTPFGLSYGNTDGYSPRGVNTAPQPSQRQRLLVLASAPAGALNAVQALTKTKAPGQKLSEYVKPDQLALLPEGAASLYKTPWRSSFRTVSAAKALDGVGVYYKHVPNEWTEAEHTNVMKQMAAAGVRRLRLAPHHTIYITKDWKAPKDLELASLRNELRAAKAAGIRPCIVFVHIPPIGKPGTRELQDWWRQGELMPPGEVGSTEFKAYLDKTYEALWFILAEARSAGFTAPDSYDLEMGQGLWWGGPAAPRPPPSTTLDALRPGGRIYEFDRALALRLRRDGFAEPTLWWGQTYHHFENCRDDEVPPECVGRSISFYSSWTGITSKGWLAGSMYDRVRNPNDVWPVRSPLSFIEGTPPQLVLARPEGWMADRTRHDNLIELIRASKTPVAITSLGTVPGQIPEIETSALSGWEIKQRALTRSLAFWLNQGASFVLLHSAYEPGSPARGEMAHSLIPGSIDPAKFRWQEAPPLVTLRAFCDGLASAKPVETLTDLRFRYALTPDPVLIPGTGRGQPLRASDAVALLPFQLSERSFAVAAYVVSPNVAQRMRPVRMTLQIDRSLTSAGASLIEPYTQTRGCALVIARSSGSATVSFDIHDDVTWLRFETE